MIRPQRTSLAVVAILGACASLTWATAPSDQVVSGDGPGTSLYSVVDFLHPSAANPAVANKTFDDGTGSIVGKKQVGTDGYLCIITADHVVSGGSTFVAIGSSGAAGAAFPFVTTGVGGPTGKEDVRFGYVDVGNITAAGAPLTLYNNITPLQVANPMQGRVLKVKDLFTQYGYGDTGSAYTQPVTMTPGYQDVNSSFVKRFQNNTVASISASAASPYAAGAYTEPLVNWNTVAPANGDGTGTSFGGDSGGPYLTSYPSSITINRGGTNVTILNLTDFIGAVHVGGSSVMGLAPTTKLNGQQNYGVPIDQPLYDWQNTLCMQVPEPTVAGLIAVGAGALALRRRRGARE